MDEDAETLENAQPPRLRAELYRARSWAWAQWHRVYRLEVVDPHATGGAAAPPEWLTSGRPPWPEAPVDTSAVPDAMLRTLLGRPEATSEELAEVRRRIENPRPADRFVLSADLHAEDDDGNGFAVVELDAFQPEQVFPGASVRAGRGGVDVPVTVLRTELFEASDGQTVVHVSFRKELEPGGREQSASAEP
jgi:hypothetical protein